MQNQKVLAAINLNCILRSLQFLCELDENTKEIIGNHDLTIKFSVPGLLPLYIQVGDGNLLAFNVTNIKADINLKFTSFRHFNKMIDGEAMPIPTKGFSKLSFLQGPFTELTKLLEYYLKPESEEKLNDPKFKKINTILMAKLAFYALSQIANYDKIGKQVAKNTEDGKLVIKISDESMIAININKKRFATDLNNFNKPDALMIFKDLDIAGGILRGELDSFGAIGQGDLRVCGKTHTIDNINRLLGLVARYLA